MRPEKGGVGGGGGVMVVVVVVMKGRGGSRSDRVCHTPPLC